MEIKSLLKKVVRLFSKENRTTVNIVNYSQSNLLEGKIAIVTGGTSGIGLAITKSFLNSGATVIFTGRDQKRVQNIIKDHFVAEIFTGKIFGLALDISNVSSFEGFLDDALSLVGNRPIDILVNNAGVNGGLVKSVTESEYDNILDVNLKGTFFLSKIVAEHMKNIHLQGNILNISSSSSLRPAASAYTISKWGIRGLTLGLARAFAPYGIVVNGLAPGPTATRMQVADNSDLINKNLPLGRFIMPEEVANFAVVLVSQMGKAIMGDTVYLTGGAGLLTFEGDNYNF